MMYQKTEIVKKQQEQKQYDNLNFTVDDLLILQDKQDIDIFSNPTELLNSIYNWYDLSKENKQKLIGKYIDNLIIEKKDKTIKLIAGNFRESYIKEIMHNHDKYDIPYSWNIFEDDYGFKILMNHELKTKEQARNYFNKLTEILGIDYKLKYYEVETDDDLKNINFKTEADIEKVIRLIALKRDNKYTKGNLKLGVITIDLSDIKDKNGKQIYDEYFKKLKEKIVQ